MGCVYSQNITSKPIVFTTKGVKLKEFPLGGGGEVKQLVTHPRGGSLLLLTANKLFYVEVKQE